jgi:hypothetical protein
MRRASSLLLLLAIKLTSSSRLSSAISGFSVGRTKNHRTSCQIEELIFSDFSGCPPSALLGLRECLLELPYQLFEERQITFTTVYGIFFLTVNLEVINH